MNYYVRNGTVKKRMMSIEQFYSFIQLEEIGITATKEFQLETAMVRTLCEPVSAKPIGF